MKVRMNLFDLIMLFYDGFSEQQRKEIAKKYGITMKDIEEIKYAIENKKVKSIKVI